MKSIPKWQYDEMKHCGVDYSDPEIADGYDGHHRQFRDFEKESRRIMDLLNLGKDQTVIDIGCGTGAFVINAAKHCKKVFAVDVSEAMLKCCREKAQKEGLNNIEYYHGGFLTYEHKGEPVDGAVSMIALHHLPDFWKMIGLDKLSKMIKKGGRLLLYDVVFSFDPDNYISSLNEWRESFHDNVGAHSSERVEIHIRDEYSTFDWIMEGMLKRAGFRIDKANYDKQFLTTYLCTRE